MASRDISRQPYNHEAFHKTQSSIHAKTVEQSQLYSDPIRQGLGWCLLVLCALVRSLDDSAWDLGITPDMSLEEQEKELHFCAAMNAGSSFVVSSVRLPSQ